MSKKKSNINKIDKKKINFNIKKKNNDVLKNNDKNSEKYQKNRRVIFILLFAFFFIFLISIISIFYFRTYVVNTYEVNLTAKVGDYVGFNLDIDKIHMGTMFPGGSATRQVFVSANKDGYYYLTSKTNNMDGWIYVSAQNQRVYANENSSIMFYVFSPIDAELGNYEEIIKVYVVKSKVCFLTKWLFIKEEPIEIVKNRIPENNAGKVSLNIINNSTNESVSNIE